MHNFILCKQIKNANIIDIKIKESIFMKMNTRLFEIIAFVALIWFCFNACKNEPESEPEFQVFQNGLYFLLNDEKTGYTVGTSKLLSIVEVPSSVNGLPVIGISDRAFYGCTSLAIVTIPSSVTFIGYKAFEGCTSLASITIPNSVTSIGLLTFSGCTSLAIVTIPDSVTSIGQAAFYGCTSLTSVTIPNSVTFIGEYAFRGCTSLASITIPNSVTSIGYKAFEGCTSLASVTFEGFITYDKFRNNVFGTRSQEGFIGNLRDTYFNSGIGIGTYTREEGGLVWTKQ